MSVEPEVITVKRYRCPLCGRSASTSTRARQHIRRCWLNPDAHGCKTCQHFDRYGGTNYGDWCEVGVDLTGKPACPQCGGYGEDCTGCGGKGAEVKPGPVIHCPLWESLSFEDVTG